jgi:hypothetical protein
MSSKRAQIINAFLNEPAPLQVFLAEVLDVSERWCTVRLVHSDLEVENVKLVAEEDAGDFAILYPRVGSLVLVGCVENEASDLYVAMAGEVDGGKVVIGGTEIVFDKSNVSLKTDKTELSLTQGTALLKQGDNVVELANRKIKVTNGSVNLKGLFDDLATLLQSFVVLTAQGPSTGLSPTSVTAITNLKTKVATLLA